jgi:hypothetical protein
MFKSVQCPVQSFQGFNDRTVRTLLTKRFQRLVGNL